ncbi:MAG: hypothetical protein GY761_13550 [Hyphomicrobiales bacterium]|nr:hypothetical protein [Hyphomicrobiales bacterium]
MGISLRRIQKIIQPNTDDVGNVDDRETEAPNLALDRFIERIELTQTQIVIYIDTCKLQSVLTNNESTMQKQEPEVDSGVREDHANSNIKQITISHQLRKRGVEAKLVLTDGNIQTPNPDQNLIKLIAKTHLWFTKLSNGTVTSISDLANQQNKDAAEISRFLPLAFLAPTIIEAILAGAQPVDLTIEKLRGIPALPITWTEQRELLGFAN